MATVSDPTARSTSDGAHTEDIRKLLHEEIDRMEECHLQGLQEFLATYPSHYFAALRNAPYDDEPVTEEEWADIAEMREWWKHNEGIPHEQVMRNLGLE